MGGSYPPNQNPSVVRVLLLRCRIVTARYVVDDECRLYERSAVPLNYERLLMPQTEVLADSREEAYYLLTLNLPCIGGNIAVFQGTSKIDAVLTDEELVVL